MRNALCFASGLALLCTFAVNANAQTYTVTANDVYIRSNPGGFSIGTLYSGDHFRRVQTNGSDYWGYCGGTASKCAWVPSAYLALGGSVSTVCGGSGSTATGIGSRQYLLANYAKCVNDYVPGHFFIDTGGGTSASIPAGLTANLYGNYDGTTFHHQIPGITMDSSSSIAWRWISDSGEAVMVKLANQPWGFMRRDKLTTTLKYADGNYRTDAQGTGN
jgi:hypothetical protein